MFEFRVEKKRGEIANEHTPKAKKSTLFQQTNASDKDNDFNRKRARDKNEKKERESVDT